MIYSVVNQFGNPFRESCPGTFPGTFPALVIPKFSLSDCILDFTKVETIFFKISRVCEMFKPYIWLRRRPSRPGMQQQPVDEFSAMDYSLSRNTCIQDGGSERESEEERERHNVLGFVLVPLRFGHCSHMKVPENRLQHWWAECDDNGSLRMLHRPWQKTSCSWFATKSPTPHTHPSHYTPGFGDPIIPKARLSLVDFTMALVSETGKSGLGMRGSGASFWTIAYRIAICTTTVHITLSICISRFKFPILMSFRVSEMCNPYFWPPWASFSSDTTAAL